MGDWCCVLASRMNVPPCLYAGTSTTASVSTIDMYHMASVCFEQDLLTLNALTASLYFLLLASLAAALC